jgi:hypothetical protein
MPMPEAAMNEENLPESRKNDVRRARQVASVQSETKSEGMYRSADD